MLPFILKQGEKMRMRSGLLDSPYAYAGLRGPLANVRLASIQPGNLDDAIPLEISWVPSPGPSAPLPQRLSTHEPQASVPPGWKMLETIEIWYLSSHSPTRNGLGFMGPVPTLLSVCTKRPLMQDPRLATGRSPRQSTNMTWR